MNRATRRRGIIGFAAAALSPVAIASGAVSLSFVDASGPPQATSANQGTSFTVSLKLISNGGSQVTGVDYFLLSSASNIFTITARNTQSVSSAFTDVFSNDTAVVPADLNPKNGTDLGGSVSNVNSPISNNTFEVADFTISIAANVPSGIYTLMTTSNPGTGYEGAGPDFADTSFSQHAFYTVTVPDPASATFLGFGALGLITRRRSDRRAQAIA